MPPGPLSKLMTSGTAGIAIATAVQQPVTAVTAGAAGAGASASSMLRGGSVVMETPPQQPLQDSILSLVPHNSNANRRELALALFRAGAVGFLTFYVVRWILRFADPTYQQKQKAKIKANEIMQRLGVRGLVLNEHEVMIASHLVDPGQLKVGWGDVAGLDSVIENIKRTVICPVVAQRRIVRVSRLIQPPKGILLYGPPGCGKTLIAKAMAKEAKCWFINLDVSVLTDKWYGESQKLTAAVFSLAEKLQPCIIFIDEIDSLLRLRATQDHEVTAMMKAQFMSLWDGLITDPQKTVIVMGATNRPKDMDTAILRRMAAKFHVPSPDLEQRKHILDLTLKNEVVGEDFDLAKLAEITDGFSGSDLKEVARSAAVSCLAEMPLGGSGGTGVCSRQSSNKSNRSVGSSSVGAVDGSGDGDTSPHQPRRSTGWFSNLFSSSSSSSHNNESSHYSHGNSSSSSSMMMGIRPITMRDFEIAVKKSREAKAHCNNSGGFRANRLELD